MSHRIIQIHTQAKYKKDIEKLRKEPQISDSWCVEKGKDITYSLLVETQITQNVTDRLQALLGKNEGGSVVVLSVQATLLSEKEGDGDKKSGFKGISREELYSDIYRGAQINRTFILMVIFSTIAAAFGMLENNVAVVIGAMVIAPMLSPNIALALATILGDRKLIKQSIITNLTGLVISLVIAIIIGALWPYGFEAEELVSRTDVRASSIIIAIVSGAAGVLSLASGVSSALVGVMMAAALLPPAVTLGIMVGAGQNDNALGAFLLLAVNIVCVNLAAKITFMFKGVEPRTWYRKKKAKAEMRWYLFFWIASLIVLAAIIYFRGSM